MSLHDVFSVYLKKIHQIRNNLSGKREMHGYIDDQLQPLNSCQLS